MGRGAARHTQEQWDAIRACVEADVIVIVQAANTGLTGGSTSNGRYDRPVVVINTLRLSALHVARDDREVVCLAGATLNRLEKRLAPIGREPHSVIASSCIGASVVGGLCNGSGGTLIRREPDVALRRSDHAWSHCRALDRTDALNPEVGQTSPRRHWR